MSYTRITVMTVSLCDVFVFLPLDPVDPAFYPLIHDVVPNATPEQFNSFINAVPSYPGSYFYGMDFTRVSREQYAVMITQYVLQHRRTDLIRVLLQITMECESQSYRQHR